MKYLYILILASAALLCGCKATGHIDPGIISRVDLGMTRSQVITAIGAPESDAAEGNAETMFYVEERPWWQWVRMQVKLIDGKVVSYGEAPH
jgi:outer membrane protein assembly factor BamE (lipoprotein component of BamABCDE complex)